MRFGTAGLTTPVLVTLVWVLHPIEKNAKSPTADGAEIIKELGPFDESRVVISIEEIGCVFGGALEESASGVDWDDVAMGLKVIK